jgi:hypothetical protein
MADDSGAPPRVAYPEPLFTRTYRRLARGSSVNAETLLATDYLNHVNEVVMLIEMVGAAPEVLADIAAWRPKPYAEHFAASAIADRALAILAYDQAPLVFRIPFDETIEAIDAVLLDGIAKLRDAAPEDYELVAAITSSRARELIDRASAIIHGHTDTARQDDIDRLMAEPAQQPRE